MSESTELARATPDDAQVLNDGDMRAGLMTLPATQMVAVLTEYDQRRNTMRDWLLRNMTEGVHYGFPPGMEPKYDAQGNVVSKRYDKKTGGYIESRFSLTSYTPKMSLYKPGAQLVADLFHLVPVFDADTAAWQMMGGKHGTIVMRCRLYPKGVPHDDHNLKGEGRGVREVGQKGGDANNAIKMAQKCALVDAVINGLGIGDLFTQDIEDDKPPPPPVEPPSQRQGGPVVHPRPERVSKEDLADLHGYWKETMTAMGADASGEAFRAFIVENGGPALEPTKANSWSKDQLTSVGKAVDRLRGEA